MTCTPATITIQMNTQSANAPPEYFGTPQCLGNPCCGLTPLISTFPNFCTVEVGLASPISIFPLPESDEGSQAAIIVKVEGNSQSIRITWTIKDEANYYPVGHCCAGLKIPPCECCACTPPGFDIAGGTLAGNCTAETQFEQLEFWTTTFENRSICQSFNFKINTGICGETYCRTVLLRDFKATISMDAPVTWNASLDMIAGVDVNTIDEGL